MIFPTAMMETSFRRYSLLAMILLTAASALLAVTLGCGRREVLGKVTGRVTLEGEPVKQGYVIFRNDTKGVHMMAEMDASGNYEVSMAGGYGLPLGEYRVYLSPPVAEIPFGPAQAPPQPSEVAKFPEKFLQPETSGLKLIVAKGDNRFDIDMLAE